MKKMMMAMLAVLAACGVRAAADCASDAVCREMEVSSGGEVRLAAGATLEMPSFDGTSVSVVLGTPSVSGGGVETYGGRVVGSTMNNVSAVSYAGGFVVTVARANGTRLTFSYADGVWTIREFRALRGGKCGTKKRRKSVTSGFRAKESATPLTGDPLVDGAEFMLRGETKTNVIDVMVVVDASAAKWMKKKSSCRDFPDPVYAFCAEAVQRCKNMYANTGLDAFFTFNLVHVERLDYDFSQLRDENGDVDSERVLTHLIGIDTPSQAAFKKACESVRAARNAYGADIVSCLVSCGDDEPDGVLGIGGGLDDEKIRNVSFAEEAYNVCLVESVALGNTMAHEIGHNMGAGHAEMADKENSGPQLYGYSTGMYFNVTNAAGNVFMHAASVMAYDDDGRAEEFENCGRWGVAGEIVTDPDSWNNGMFTETGFFSSAKHTYRYMDENGVEIDSGVLTGDELHDNTRLLSLTYPVVANYRVSVAGVEGRYGPYVPGVEVSNAIPLLVGYAAKGLPTGLKFNSKTGTISGTPTKPTGDAGATVTFTKKNYETYTTQIIVGPLPVLTVEVVGGGKVAGAGAYAANRKVTLKATANKGNVFAGWYDNADAAAEGGGRGATAPVSRLASYVLAMPTNDVTLYAKFIEQSEDWAEVACYAEDEYETKQPIEPIEVQVESGSLPTVKVTGLPTGLKFTGKLVTAKVTTGTGKAKVTTLVTNALPNQIYGTPTKSGVYTTTVTVTTAGKATASTNLTFVVRKESEKLLKIACDATMGKVTGAGIYTAGKKVTLKATANKGYVFAGWYEENPSGGEGLAALPGASDYRTASFSYTMPDDDTTVYAKFVSASEDTDIALAVEGEKVTADAADTIFNTAGALTLALEADSVTLPKIAITGLPTGLKFTDKLVTSKVTTGTGKVTTLVTNALPNTIYGMATKPGTYVVTAKLTNTTVKKAIERKFTIVVNNLTGANDVLVCTDADGNDVGIANSIGESYALTVGVSELALPQKIKATTGTVKMTGLPTGLKYDAKTGAITGVATKAGTYTVYVTVGKAVSTFTVVVDPLPDWVVGTFEGYMYEHYRDYYDIDLGRCIWKISIKGELSYAESGTWGGKVQKNSGKVQLSSIDDGKFTWTWHETGPNGTWGDTLKCVSVFATNINGVVLGAIKGSNEGFDGDGEYLSGYITGIGLTANDTFLAPSILCGAVTEISLDGWLEDHEYGDPLDGWRLQLKHGKKGTVTAALFAPGERKASSTCSAQLAVYDYDADRHVQKCFVTTIFACRSRYSIGMTLYLEIDCSHGIANGDDVRVVDYLLQNDDDD